MSDSPASSARSLGAPLGWPARLLLAAAVFVVFFAGLGSYSLLEPDEGRYAEIPREMLATGDFVSPHLNGVLYFEKPPLYYWLNAAALSLPGRPELLCRLAGALLGVAGLGLAWALGRSLGGPRVALISAAVLGSSPLWIALARATIIDMTLTFFLSATLVCFWLAQAKNPGDRGERLLWYGMFAAAALATLAKGLIGFVIPGAVIFFYLLFARRWRLLPRVPWIGGIAVFLAIALPWHVLAARRNPDFLWFYFVHEHFQRYATPEADRQEPFWFFAAILGLGLLPWSGLLPAAARLYRRGAGRLRDQPGLIFLACWAGFVFLFFSASQSKLVPYILPAMPPLAVLIALRLAKEEHAGEDRRTGSWVRAGGTLGALALAVLAAALIWIALGRVKPISAGVMPALLALSLAALAACLVSAWLWLRGRLGSGGPLAAAALAPALVILCLVSLGNRAAQRLSSEPIARFLAGRLAPEDEVFAYRCYPQTLPVYLRRQIGLVEYQGELEFGQQHLKPEVRARRFPDVASFRSLWNSSRTIYLVVEEKRLPRLERDGLATGQLLMRQDKYLLMTNRPPAPRSAG